MRRARPTAGPVWTDLVLALALTPTLSPPANVMVRQGVVQVSSTIL